MAAFCTNCAAALEPGVKFCASCGSPIEAPAPPPPPITAFPGPATVTGASTHYSSAATSRRYPALRIVAIILKVAAVIWVVLGVVTLIFAIASSNNPPFGSGVLNGVQGLALLLVCLYFAVMSWAGAELLHVFMDIEENTRRAAAK